MSDITYINKNKNGTVGTAPTIWSDSDANEVKTAVNSKVDKETGFSLVPDTSIAKIQYFPLLFYKMVTVQIGEESVVAGSSFTPPLTKEPRLIDCYIGGARIAQATGYTANGEYYDINLAATDEVLTDLKITVLCINS